MPSFPEPLLRFDGSLSRLPQLITNPQYQRPWRPGRSPEGYPGHPTRFQRPPYSISHTRSLSSSAWGICRTVMRPDFRQGQSLLPSLLVAPASCFSSLAATSLRNMLNVTYARDWRATHCGCGYGAQGDDHPDPATPDFLELRSKDRVYTKLHCMPGSWNSLLLAVAGLSCVFESYIFT